MEIIQSPVLSMAEEDRNAVVSFMDLVITNCRKRTTCDDCIFDGYCDNGEDFAKSAKKFLNFFTDGDRIKTYEGGF